MADESWTETADVETFEAYVADVLAADARKKDGTMSLLLTCIDYRYPRRILDAMQRFTPGVPYDQFILAGASLGASREDWLNVLVQHVDGARALGHRIERIVILDHRDCGAYQQPRKLGIPEYVLPVSLPKDILPSAEKMWHENVLAEVVPEIRRRLAHIPNMKIDAWLLTREQDDPLAIR
ncbi:MAG TPA: hypothetical protein VEG34_08415 [Thermoanaerobaculia bacterium]|nr:hypothetical protein [Thermoanaerobaculia bacterium]